MNITFAFLSAILAASNVSATPPSPTAGAAPARKVISAEQMEALRYKRTGGEVLKRGTYTGMIAVLNAADAKFTADAEKAAQLLKSNIEVNIVAAPSKIDDPAVALKESGANAVVLVVDKPGTPEILIAPNDRWAVVNVANIVKDLPAASAKDKFRAPRIRKQIIKAFSSLMGGSASQYPGNVMNTATTRELDVNQEQMPMDVVDKIQKYCRRLGITPAEYVTYKHACREGWAPAPTNDVQKAIWDKVRSMPERPIKIKFDPKRDAGK